MVNDIEDPVVRRIVYLLDGPLHATRQAFVEVFAIQSDTDVIPGCRRGRGRLELENMRGFYYASSLLLLLPLCNGQEVRTTSVSISSPLSPSST